MIMATRWIPFALMIAAVAVVVVYQINITREAPPAAYPINRTVKYSLTVKNPSHEPVTQASFWLYAPVRQGVYQIVDEIASSHPYTMEEDGAGNQRMRFQIEHLPPFGQKGYTVTARLRLSESPNRLPSIPQDQYLAEERFMELSDSRIQRLAATLSADTDHGSVKNIFQWVIGNIENSGYIPREQGALQTLIAKSGDCTNTMYLFSALSRANGIPTRNMAGFTARENAVLKPRDYHNWLEVYVDGEWRLIDPDKGIFMERAADYIAMTVLKDASTLALQQSQRLFGGSENIQISMN